MFVSVQWLRGLAAAMVVYFHATAMVREQVDATIQVATFAAAGVDLFFVISGFIMATTSGRISARSREDVRYFLFRRFVRVMPMYWGATAAKLAIVLVMPRLAAHSTVTLPYVIASLLLVPMANDEGNLTPLLVVGWTLSFEAFFYITFALTMRSRVGAVRLTSMLFTLCALLGVCFPLEKIASPLTLLSPLLLEFVAGMWIAVALERKRVPAIPVAVLCVGVAAACVGASALLPTSFCYQYRAILWGVPSAVFMLGVLAIEQRRGCIKETVFRLLGDASYAIYLVHTFVLPAVGRACAMLPPTTVPSVVVVLTGVVVSLVAGIVVHKYVETPLLQRLRHLWPGRAVAPQGATS